MNHYDDSPDTTVWIDPLPQRFGTGLGHGRCGCSPTDGQSCPSCTGESAAEWEDVKARRDEVRQQWRRREITPREYYALSAAVSSDGMPSRDAVEAMARAERAETQGSAA